MCFTEIYTFNSCEHRIANGEIEPCGAVRVAGAPQCDPVEQQILEMGEKCHECLEALHHSTLQQREGDEAAELERILAESAASFQVEQSRPPRISDEEQEILDCVLHESAQMESQPPRGDYFDDDELSKIMALSLESHAAEVNKPKHYLKQRMRFSCGHETELPPTDIEFDPTQEGLPYILHDDYGHCPDCGGSSSHAATGRAEARPGHILGDADPLTNVSGHSDSFSGIDDDLIDLSPQSKGKGPRGVEPQLPHNSAHTDNSAYLGAPLPGPVSSASGYAHPDSQTLRQQRVHAFEPQRHVPRAPEPAPYDSDSDSDDDGIPGLPSYATVDDLALQGLIGEQREASEREERNRVERLRYEGTMAQQDAGNMDDPIPRRD